MNASKLLEKFADHLVNIEARVGIKEVISVAIKQGEELYVLNVFLTTIQQHYSTLKFGAEQGEKSGLSTPLYLEEYYSAKCEAYKKMAVLYEEIKEIEKLLNKN
jgi:hypothetical protein